MSRGRRLQKHVRLIFKAMRKELPTGFDLTFGFSSTHHKVGVRRDGRLLGFVIVSSSPRGPDFELMAARADLRRLVGR